MNEYREAMSHCIPPEDLEDMDDDLEALLELEKFEREFCQDTAELDPAEL